jgi:anthranilate/para-aminobenzoate synthase component II
LIGVIGIQCINLFFLNKVRQNQRVKHGKPKFINDTSMSKAYVAYGTDQQEGTVKLGQNGKSLFYCVADFQARDYR